MLPDTSAMWTVTLVSFVVFIQTTVSAGDADTLERAYEQMREDMRLGRCTPMLDAFIHCRQRNDYIGADENRVDDDTGDFPKDWNQGPQVPSGSGPVESGPPVNPSGDTMTEAKLVDEEATVDKRKDWKGLRSYLKLMGYGRRK